MFKRQVATPRQPLGQVEARMIESVTLDRQGRVTARARAEARYVVEDLGSWVELQLAAVPAGAFQMGSRHEGGYPDEQPLHPVFLEAFWMGADPILQGQWQAVMGSLPGCRFHGADLPVENISWRDAQRFCERLVRLTGRGYSLPSEAQWEYACRAGTATPFYTGETITTDYANYVGEHTFREEAKGVYRHVTTPARSFLPNGWGLYDMHGQVWEFCQDVWFEDYAAAPPAGEARSSAFHAQSETPYRVARGGSWHEPPLNCRSAVRLRVAEDDRMEYYSLRVVLAHAVE